MKKTHDSSSVTLKENSLLGGVMDFDLMSKPFNFDKVDMDFNLDGHFPNSQKQTPPTLSTKRKILETQHVHGTTVLGCACLDVDDEFIAVVADGRTFVTKEGFDCPTAEDDGDNKIRIHKEFVGSSAGNVGYGLQLIEELEGLYEDSKGNMSEVIKRRKLDVNEWKKDSFVKKDDPLRSKDEYPASVIMYAFDQNYIHVAAKGDDIVEAEICVRRKRMKLVGHGIGGAFALKHFVDNKKRIVSLSSAFRLMKEALGAALLQTRACGGIVYAAIGTRVDGFGLVNERVHTTEVIASEYKHLKKYMERMLIVFANGSYMEEPAKERKKETVMLDCHPGLEELSILGFDYGWKQTVRWLRFHSPQWKELYKVTGVDWNLGKYTYSEPTKEVFEWLSPLLKKSIGRKVLNDVGNNDE